MGIVSWIVLGAIAGFIANMIVGGKEGVILTIVLGIVGAVVGGYLAQAIFHKGDVTGVNVESIVIAAVGAIVVLFVWRAVAGRRAIVRPPASGPAISMMAADGAIVGRRYVRLVRGVVGGIVPAQMRLTAGLYEDGASCAVVVADFEGGATAPLRGAVVPRLVLDALLSSLDQMGAWDLPVERPFGSEDLYGMDTSLWLSDGLRRWHNGAPSGCVRGRSEAQPTDAQRQTFAAAIERILAFVDERVEPEKEAVQAALDLLVECSAEGARHLARDASTLSGSFGGDDD